MHQPTSPASPRPAAKSTLTSLTDMTPDMLTLGAWIEVNGYPAQIRDLRLHSSGGRVVHLADGRLVSLGRRDLVTVYNIAHARRVR